MVTKISLAATRRAPWPSQRATGFSEPCAAGQLPNEYERQQFGSAARVGACSQPVLGVLAGAARSAGGRRPCAAGTRRLHSGGGGKVFWVGRAGARGARALGALR